MPWAGWRNSPVVETTPGCLTSLVPPNDPSACNYLRAQYSFTGAVAPAGVTQGDWLTV